MIATVVAVGGSAGEVTSASPPAGIVTAIDDVNPAVCAAGAPGVRAPRSRATVFGRM